jgi:hypothetical protein
VTTDFRILQIVPRSPGPREAVGDYAETLARKLRTLTGLESDFVTGATLSPAISPSGHVILHYVNYGYQPRGIPFGLLAALRELQPRCPGRFITIFHELYASGSPRQSAFWLRPLQVHIARAIARLSDHCVVPNEIAQAQLLRLAPNAAISVHPVFSNFGEPKLLAGEISAREPHHWVIGGGTAAIARGLRSLRARISDVPPDVAPRLLHLIGGNENEEVRTLIGDTIGMEIDFRPQIDAADASAILRKCSFAWIDYFHREDVPGPVIFKSSIFAAACAHAVVPVFPHRLSPLALGSDVLPGPYYLGRTDRDLPAAAERSGIAAQHHDWYHRHASSEVLAPAVAAMLTAPPSSSPSR